MLCDLPFVKGYKNRHGKWVYYFRRKGHRPVRLLGEPGTPEFLTQYQEAMKGPAPVPAPPGVTAGSFDALCRDYLASADFAAYAKSTRQEMGYVIEALRLEHATKPVKLMARRHIIDWKNKLAGKPGAANKMLRTVKTLLNYAVEKEYLKENPAKGVKMMKLGRFRAWNDDELKAFEKVWKLGTMQRMIFDLALYTGQRRADVAAFKRTDVHGPNLIVRQQKTRKDLVIHVHRNLAKSMAAYLPTHTAETIIAGPTGTSITPHYMSAIFREAAGAAELPKDCVLHGLRKTTARVLAEIGEKSSPVTGHMTRAMQDEYERDASQQKMAKAAILKWEKKRA